MVNKLAEWLAEYVKGQPYWAAIRPLVVFLVAYAIAVYGGYQIFHWHYGFAPALEQYVASHVYIWITFLLLAAATFTLLIKMIRFFSRARDETEARPLVVIEIVLRRYWRDALWVLVTISVVVLLAAPIVLRLTPVRPANITVKLIVEPDAATQFDPQALAYLIYELNKRQRHWHFDLDLNDINSAKIAEQCESEEHRPLCMLEAWRGERGGPCIGITTEPLGGTAKVWQHTTSLSVVTTHDLRELKHLNVYDYLAYCLIVQSIAVHLDTHCPSDGPKDYAARSSSGSVLDFSPPLAVFKAMVLTGRLSPSDEQRLLRCFGPDYLNRCRDLVSLGWLHGGDVATKLERHYGVSFNHGTTPKP